LREVIIQKIIDEKLIAIVRGMVPFYRNNPCLSAKAAQACLDAVKAAITLRGSISASDNKWSGMLYDGEQAFFSPNYPVHIVDRVGGGDSFGGALIYSLLKNYDGQKAINFAPAASCLKHSIEHDFNLVSVQEAEALAGGNASGRVQR
jgi:2-dehydro-3-deoxygluconokinase